MTQRADPAMPPTETGPLLLDLTKQFEVKQLMKAVEPPSPEIGPTFCPPEMYALVIPRSLMTQELEEKSPTLVVDVREICNPSMR